jgi:phosphate transport system permease protein
VSAGLTLAILVLPIVIITSAEALRAVPQGLREAGFGVGATRWEVTKHHVLPYAAPGILTGTVLALARALGEAAPLILVGATTGYLTSGDSFALASLRDRFTAMPILITTWAGRPGADWEAVTAAAIVVLLLVVLLANATAILLRNRFEKRRA